MLSRYPHTASIIAEIPGTGPFPEPTTETIVTKGRYEPASQKRDLDQSAKFYCPLLDILKADPHALDGQKMIYEGRTINIVQAWNYQTHCELWLD